MSSRCITVLAYLAVFFACAGKAHAAATPTLVQYVAGPSGGGTGYPKQDFRLRNGSLAGNLIVVVGQYGTNASVSVSVKDDQSQTYTVITGSNHSANQTMWVAYFPNTVAGVRDITITYSGANATFQSHFAAEFNNIVTSSPVAANNSNTNTGTAITCGSVTPSQANDLVVAAAEADSTGSTTSWATGTNSGYTWNLVMADRGDGGQAISQEVQWATAPNTTAVNPAITSGTSTSYSAMTVIFKASASSQGSPAPSGIFAGSSIHYNAPSFNSGHVFQIPLTGNLLVLVAAYPNTQTISSIAVSSNSGMTHIGHASDPGNNAEVDMWYLASATLAQTTTMTLTTTGSMAELNMTLYGITAAHPSPLDTSATCTGTMSSGYCSTNGSQGTQNANITPYNFTPSSPNGILIWSIQVVSPQIQGTSGSLAADTAYSVSEATQNELDENNGESHFYYSSASAVTGTFTTVSGVSGVGGWSSQTAAFKAAPGAGGDFNKQRRYELLEATSLSTKSGVDHW